MRKLSVIPLIVFLFAVPLVAGEGVITVRDNMRISIPPDDFIEVLVEIPDDLGVEEEFEFEYIIESSASSDWDSLTIQHLRTDFYNKNKIPIVFDTRKKEEGECTGKFEIKLSCPALDAVKIWSGEVCVSAYADIDIPSRSSRNGTETINDHVDLFDAALIPHRKVAKVGEETEFKLNVESYADLDVELEAGDEIDMVLQSASVSVSKSSPKKAVKVTVTAPDESGEYEFTVTAKADCDEGFCERVAKGILHVIGVDDTVSDLSYTLSVFPTNINIKELEPVEFEATVHNPGSEKNLNITLDVPSTLTSDFEYQEITVASGEEKSIAFTVTPKEELSLGIIKVTSKYTTTYNEEEKVYQKFVTAQITTNEMLSDTMRYAGELMSEADDDTRNDITSAMDDWASKYADSEYGDLSDYGTIKDRLSAAESDIDSQQQEPNGNGPDVISDNGTGEQWNPFSDPIVLAVLIIAPIAAILGFIMLRKRSSSEDFDKLDV